MTFLICPKIFFVCHLGKKCSKSHESATATKKHSPKIGMALHLNTKHQAEFSDCHPSSIKATPLYQYLLPFVCR